MAHSGSAWRLSRRVRAFVDVRAGHTCQAQGQRQREGREGNAYIVLSCVGVVVWSLWYCIGTCPPALHQANADLRVGVALTRAPAVGAARAPGGWLFLGRFLFAKRAVRLPDGSPFAIESYFVGAMNNPTMAVRAYGHKVVIVVIFWILIDVMDRHP